MASPRPCGRLRGERELSFPQPAGRWASRPPERPARGTDTRGRRAGHRGAVPAPLTPAGYPLLAPPPRPASPRPSDLSSRLAPSAAAGAAARAPAGLPRGDGPRRAGGGHGLTAHAQVDLPRIPVLPEIRRELEDGDRRGAGDGGEDGGGHGGAARPLRSAAVRHRRRGEPGGDAHLHRRGGAGAHHRQSAGLQRPRPRGQPAAALQRFGRSAGSQSRRGRGPVAVATPVNASGAETQALPIGGRRPLGHTRSPARAGWAGGGAAPG